jgi:hypothetical protein
VTNDRWRGHFRRLDDYLNRIEAKLDRIDADPETGMIELTARGDRLEARVARRPNMSW